MVILNLLSNLPYEVGINGNNAMPFINEAIKIKFGFFIYTNCKIIGIITAFSWTWYPKLKKIKEEIVKMSYTFLYFFLNNN